MTDLNSIAKKTVALVMAGGRGSRLGPLTEIRSKPAVYFGGKFRIIDFALSNCMNSGIKKIAIFTQYKAHSLIRHLNNGWSFLKPDMNEFLEIIPASQMVDETMWYRGTADSIAQNISILSEYPCEYFVVLAGDHIYKMNYAKMVQDHIEKGSGCTVACIQVPKKDATEFGVMKVDDSYKIVDFLEKPQNPPTIPGSDTICLASMGIYVFDKKFLLDILQKDISNSSSSHDFGKDIIPACVAQGITYAHPFEKSCIKSSPDALDYWKDVGTIDSYWNANINLTMPLPEFDMYDKEWPVLTHQIQLPSAKFIYNDGDANRKGFAVDSLVSGGCIISGSAINRSILFSEVRVNSFSSIDNSLLLPRVEIGRKCTISKAIIDRGCVVPPNTQIGQNRADDERRFFVTESGVVLVTNQHLENLK